MASPLFAVAYMGIGSGNFGGNNRCNNPTIETMYMKSDSIRRMFCKRHSAGVLYRDISKELGISLRTASNWAREMGLPLRRGGPRRQRWMPGKRTKIARLQYS
jgi:hypothetical protein